MHEIYNKHGVYIEPIRPKFLSKGILDEISGLGKQKHVKAHTIVGISEKGHKMCLILMDVVTTPLL
jgi:hypothetical protein